MSKRIVTDINGRTQVFKNIAMLTNMRIERNAMAVKTASFVEELNNYRDNLDASSQDLKLVDMLTEESIMNGTINPKMLDALQIIGLTVDNLKAFKSLGFSTDVPELSEIDNIMSIAYTALPELIKDIWNKANQAFTAQEYESVYLDMLRLGIATSAEKLLTFNKYMSVNNIIIDNLSEEELDSLLVDHRENYEEWMNISIEETLTNLMEAPTSTSFVAPIGIEELFTSIKAISPSLYDSVTDFGENTDNINFARTQSFITTVKNLPVEKRDGIITVITAFNEKNKAGVLTGVNGEVQTIPGVVSVPDVLVGLLLHVGEVILSFDEVVKGTPSELMDSIESEEVKTVINLLAEKCLEYDNSTVIAMNLISMPSKFVPQLMFQDMIMRITGMPELTNLINNIGELLFSKFFDEMENEEGDDSDVK